MNGTTVSLGELRLLATMLQGVKLNCDVMICPPASLLMAAQKLLRGGIIRLGGQDCHPEPQGAHTGDIAAEMLKDAGASAVIVGHSERRTHYLESDTLIRAKAQAAHRSGLAAIICVGETLEERKQGHTMHIVGKQLEGSLPEKASGGNTILAYEPVWAIGTGLTPSSSEIASVHAFIREKLAKM